MPEHNVDLGAGNGQPRNVMMGSQCDFTLSFVLIIDQSTTPAPDPGPSNDPRLRPVFDMGPDSEAKENEEGNDERRGVFVILFVFGQISSLLEDPRLARGEEARQLDVEREPRL